MSKPKSSVLQILFPFAGYLLGIVVFVAAIHYGGLAIDRGAETDNDNGTFLGIFFYLAGGLVSIGIFLSVYLSGKEKRKRNSGTSGDSGGGDSSVNSSESSGNCGVGSDCGGDGGGGGD